MKPGDTVLCVAVSMTTGKEISRKERVVERITAAGYLYLRGLPGIKFLLDSFRPDPQWREWRPRSWGGLGPTSLYHLEEPAHADRSA